MSKTQVVNHKEVSGLTKVINSTLYILEGFRHLYGGFPLVIAKSGWRKGDMHVASQCLDCMSFTLDWQSTLSFMT